MIVRFNLFEKFIERHNEIIKKFPEISLSESTGEKPRKMFTYMIGDYCLSQFNYYHDLWIDVIWNDMQYEHTWGNTAVIIRNVFLTSTLDVSQLEQITDEMIETFYTKKINVVKNLGLKQKELDIKNKLKNIEKEFGKAKDGN
jgi:hypothetical protein